MTSQALQNVNLLRQLPDNLLVTANGSVVPRTLAELLQNASFRNAIYVINYGWIGDGTLHTVAEWIGTNPVTPPPFGGSYANLAAVQVDFPHVTSTNDSIDWAASQLAVDRIGNTYGRLVVWPTPSTGVFSETLVIGNGSTLQFSDVFDFELVFGGVPNIPKLLNDPSAANVPDVGVVFQAAIGFDANTPVVKLAGPIVGVTVRGCLAVDCANVTKYGIQWVSTNGCDVEHLLSVNHIDDGIGIDLACVAAATVESSPHGINNSAFFIGFIQSFTGDASRASSVRLDGYRAAGGADTTVGYIGFIATGFDLDGGYGLELAYTDNIVIGNLVNTTYGSVTTRTFDGSSASVVNTSTDTITITGHGFAENQRVEYSAGGGTVITGLQEAQRYFAINVTANTLQLSTIRSGSAIDLTGLGVGTSHTLSSAPAGVMLRGSSVPFNVPDNMVFLLASVGQNVGIDVDVTDGAPGRVYFNKYSLNDASDVPSGDVMAYVGLQIVTTALSTLNGLRMGVWAHQKVDVSNPFTGGYDLRDSSGTLVGAVRRGTNNDVHLTALGGFSVQAGTSTPSDARQFKVTTTDAEHRGVFTRLATTTTEITIASGVATATETYHTIDTEADGATDDLDTLSGVALGRIVILRPANDARTVVVKNATGNLLIGSDFTMDSQVDCIGLLCIDGTNWIQLFRSDNGP